MRLFKYPAALALLLFVAASPAFADIALPNPKPNRVSEVRTDLPFSRMTIERVDGLAEVRLQIPRSQLSRMSAAAGLEEPPTRSGMMNGASTAVAGVFLSLAVVLTGVLLVRSRRRGAAVGRAAAALVVCATVAGLGVVAAYANAGLPPPGSTAQNPGTLIKAASKQPLKGSIRIEVVEDGTEIKLLVPAKSQWSGDDEE
ncbi:MAG TPA: hypothetical protein VJ866_19685 [Pyrinomonadaceae bacterium]|nr:hypothetical protein [Pyrinomonadaceae bacterium]